MTINTEQNYTLTMTEEELLYIRIAICDRNLKETCKYMRSNRGEDVIEYYNEVHTMGSNILNAIDATRG